MEDKKYELVPETVTKFYNRPMYRIRALKDFSDVKKGDLGGYVESEENLSQTGYCWIYDGSIVGLGAKVVEDAVVKGYSNVIEYSRISNNAIVEKDSVIKGGSSIKFNSHVINSMVVGESFVAFSTINERSLIEQGSSIWYSTIGSNVIVKSGAVIRFDVNSNEDYVVYKAPFSYGRSLTASTKKDIWSCEPLAETAEKLRAYLIEDEVLSEDDEYLRWFDNIVVFHKNYFNIQ
nr:MAG TPA: hypothetical protein [Caudoviricetes sp.]